MNAHFAYPLPPAGTAAENTLQVQISAQLLAGSRGQRNDALLADIVAAQCSGNSCLPLHLGLAAEDFSALMNRHFPGCLFWLALHSSHDLAWQRGALRQQLLEMRTDEWCDLRNLLLKSRRGDDVSEVWLANIVAAACLGSGHLWRDLGLPSRQALRELLDVNFPALAVRNTADMRWKKFFYKRLCDEQGAYVCRAPSCDQCVTYQECFGEET